MKLFVSKYALTIGILQVDGVICDPPSMISYRDGGYDNYVHGEGREWHRSLSEASARAEAMRDKKIASLRKQISKLEASRGGCSVLVIRPERS